MTLLLQACELSLSKPPFENLVVMFFCTPYFFPEYLLTRECSISILFLLSLAILMLLSLAVGVM